MIKDYKLGDRKFRRVKFLPKGNAVATICTGYSGYADPVLKIWKTKANSDCLYSAALSSLKGEVRHLLCPPKSNKIILITNKGEITFIPIPKEFQAQDQLLEMDKDEFDERIELLAKQVE